MSAPMRPPNVPPPPPLAASQGVPPPPRQSHNLPPPHGVGFSHGQNLPPPPPQNAQNMSTSLPSPPSNTSNGVDASTSNIAVNITSTIASPPTTTVSKPSSVGIIFPPAELRSIIDKTAQFVAKNGPEFENRVLREQKNLRFAFLYPNNPYRAYYEMKVHEYKTGVASSTQPAVPQAIADMRKKEEEKKKKKEELLMLTSYAQYNKDNLLSLTGGERGGDARPPPPNQFAIKHPFIAPLDADIIKTTAQFVARNGHRFMVGLTQREKTNPQYEFLKPTHVLFSYFSSLVDSYTKCLLPEGSHIKKLKNICTNYLDSMSRAHVKCVYEMEEERKKKEKEEKELQEKMHIQQIDWHDFVVVETLDFTAQDEELPLAAPVDFSSGKPRLPISLGIGADARDAAAAAAQEEEERTGERMETEDMEMEMDMVEDEEEFHDAVEQREKEQREKEEKEKEEKKDMDAVDMPSLLLSREKDAKVVTDYVRTRKRAEAPAAARGVVQRCPITGKFIPAEDMTRHLKVLLLDPKWKQQKDRFLEKAKRESAFAPLEDVEGNLAAFVSKRPDLFGSVQDELEEHSVTDTGGDASSSSSSASSSATSSLSAQSNIGGMNMGVMNVGGMPTVPPLGGGGGMVQSVYDPITGSSTTAIIPPPHIGGGGLPPPLPSSLNPPNPPAPSYPLTGLPAGAPAFFGGLPPPPPLHLLPPGPPPPAAPSGEALMTEAQFLAAHPENIEYKVRVSYGGDSEREELTVELSAKATVEELKKQILQKTKKSNKQQNAVIKDAAKNLPLQDGFTLAHYNLGKNSELEISF